MRKWQRQFPALLLLFIASKLTAQTDGVGTWSVLSGKYTLNKQWNLFAEAQLRSQQFIQDFHYHEYKGGIGYNLPKNGSFLVAMGHYATYQPVGEFKTPSTTEFRLWEQFVLNNNIGRLKIEHRYRVEQRFISTGYRNRFRYRINPLLPLGHKVIEKKTCYLSVFNEIFVSNEAPYFEQNRMFGGVGYQVDENFTLLAGMLHRFDNISPAVQTWKNYFQLNLFVTFGEAKSGRERHPSALD